MQMKLSALNNPRFFEALNKLLATEMPMKTAYSLKKEALKLNEEHQRGEEMRNEIITSLCKKDKKGEPKVKDGKVQFAKGKEEEAVEKINELFDVEIECRKFPIDSFGDATLSAIDLILLDDLIED